MLVSKDDLKKIEEIISTQPIDEDGVEVEGTPFTITTKIRSGDIPVQRLTKEIIVVQRGL